MKIRPAAHSDLEAILPMARELNLQHSWYTPFNAEWKNSRLADDLENENITVLVATTDSFEITGYCIGIREYLPFIEKNTLIISELYVRDSHRQQGIGKFLALELISRNHDCAFFNTEIGLQNNASKKLFQSLGFAHRSEIYWMKK